MNLYLQPTEWSCLPTAFGILLGNTPKEMFDIIGHDGSELIYPHLTNPHNRRAFHIQECIDVCMRELVFPVEFQRECFIQLEPHPVVKLNINEKRFWDAIQSISGVLVGHINDRSHAVAWCREENLIYDPCGQKYSLDKFKPELFYGLY